jgi:hypothetical protein
VIFCTASRSNQTIALDTNCKKLALRSDEPPANLHAAERRLDLPRRTCTITNDNGDTIFGNEVQPKPTSPGHDYGRTSPNRNTGRSGSRQYAAFPREPVAMSSWLQQQPPLIFMRRLGLQSMTRTLPYTAKYNSSSIITGLYKYSTQYLTMKVFLRQIYSYSFHICKLNNLKFIDDLNSQCLTQTLSQMSFFRTKGVSVKICLTKTVYITCNKFSSH